MVTDPYEILSSSSAKEFDDWAVLYDPDTGHGFGLNPAGVHVWKLFDGEHAIDTVLEELRHHAEGVPEEAGSHIEAFAEQLIAQGLAGFDSTSSSPMNNPDKVVLLPEKHSSSLTGHVSESKLCNYERPKLVNLGSGALAQGSCNQGSHAGCCGPGGSATGGNGCGTGSGGESLGCGTPCCNPTGCNGYTPSSTNCCNDGICPAGCVVGFGEATHYSGPTCYGGCGQSGSSCHN